MRSGEGLSSFNWGSADKESWYVLLSTSKTSLPFQNVFHSVLGSLGNDNGNCSENVAQNVNSRCFKLQSLLVTLRKTNVFPKLTKNVVPCVRGLAVRSSLRAILSQITMTMGWVYPWAFIFQWSRLLCMRLKEKWRHEGYVTAYSLRLRRNLTSVRKVCEAAPLFLCPQRTQRITRSVFEFRFILTGKSTMAFSTRQSWRVFKSWYRGKS